MTIATELRKRLGLLPEPSVEFVVKRNTTAIKKAGEPSRQGKGRCEPSVARALAARAPATWPHAQGSSGVFEQQRELGGRPCHGR